MCISEGGDGGEGLWSGAETNVREGILGGTKEYFSHFIFFFKSRAPYAYFFSVWKGGVSLKINDKHVNVEYRGFLEIHLRRCE